MINLNQIFNYKSKLLIFSKLLLIVFFNFACTNESDKKHSLNQIILNEKNFNDILKIIDNISDEEKIKIAKDKVLLLKNLLLKGNVEKIKNRRYSCKIEFLCNQLSINYKDLFITCQILAQKEEDPINIFTYDGTWYAGFESRRIAYEKDKELDKNPVHKELVATKRDNLEKKEIYQFKYKINNSIQIRN